MKSILIRIPKETHEKLRRVTVLNGKSINGLVLDFLKQFLGGYDSNGKPIKRGDKK